VARETHVLRSRDVAHILDCSPDDVIFWARSSSHPLAGIKTGRFWRFRKSDATKFKKYQDNNPREYGRVSETQRGHA